ncbi:restriction endonuclease [Chromobacterium violaceum]|uniref:restriction endonuclease n=1 Tax=Chromobacterium violaceum TaxID=536 RepID=UPI000C128A9C|nr:restriction endonuclease [Chromobacterium violaceum]ATP29336.1 restriction endonuclease [Chromobacterium violaceum]ATP33243.1 restriction endonuclease [Chromobacterium violaceum]
MLIGHRLHLPAGPVGSAQESGRAQGAAESGKVGGAGSGLDPHRLREVTFIGAGSSIAYLANEMAGRFEGVGADQPLLGKVSVIGVEDAWSPSVRGQGYINHQNEIIGQWGERAPAYDPGYADRGEFAAGNGRQIGRLESLGAERLEAQVKDIRRLDDGCFRLTLDDGRVLDSRQVVLGAGAGPHTSIWNRAAPQTEAEKRLGNIRLSQPEALRGKVMDLDEFMRASDADPSRFAGKTVVVHGPNAGIDAVERAGELGAKVAWFVRTTAPVLLDGNQLKFAPELAKSALHKVDALEISPTEAGGVSLSYTAPGGGASQAAHSLQADYYVYALGQDINKPGSAGAMLGEIAAQLEPVYDYDQVYSDQPFRTVLGLQSRGANSDGGLVVVGAAVAQLAGRVQHTYLDHAAERILGQLDRLPEAGGETLSNMLLAGASAAEIEAGLMAMRPEGGARADWDVLRSQVRDFLAARDYFTKEGTRSVVREVENQVGAEVASVVVSPQLGTVKAASAALSGLMPAYVGNGENNFTSDNRTMLRAGLAMRHPDLAERDASGFIQESIALRRLDGQRFVEQVAEDMLKRELLPMLERLTRESLPAFQARLARLRLPEDLSRQAEAVADGAAREAFADALGGALRERLAESAKPVRGVPTEVREAYEARLAEAAKGGGDGASLGGLWLNRS